MSITIKFKTSFPRNFGGLTNFHTRISWVVQCYFRQECPYVGTWYCRNSGGLKWTRYEEVYKYLGTLHNLLRYWSQTAQYTLKRFNAATFAIKKCQQQRKSIGSDDCFISGQSITLWHPAFLNSKFTLEFQFK